MKKFLIPLALFFGLVGFLAVGLNRDPHEIPSPLIGKLAPEFALYTLAKDEQKFSPKDMQGKVWMLNVWATWCVACREEHPVLVAFAKDNQVPIVGLSCNWPVSAVPFGWLATATRMCCRHWIWTDELASTTVCMVCLRLT